MKAAYIEQVGPPEFIRFGELRVPKVGPTDVRVKVHAVAVDPIDTYIRSGKFPIPLPFPFVIGRDMSGQVEEVGTAVTRFRAGDRVWCNNQGYDGRQGTFAEYVVASESLLYPLPAGVDEKEAVAFVHSGLTACVGLQRAQPVAGETIFVNGGSGGVGSAIIQLAKSRGLRVLRRQVPPTVSNGAGRWGPTPSSTTTATTCTRHLPLSRRRGQHLLGHVGQARFRHGHLASGSFGSADAHVGPRCPSALPGR